MAISTVNISFQDELLKQIDSIAEEEARSRSELLREAARMYIEKKNRWKSIFSFGSSTSKKLAISEEEIISEIKKIRKNTK